MRIFILLCCFSCCYSQYSARKHENINNARFHWFFYTVGSAYCVSNIFCAAFLAQLGSTSIANQYATALRTVLTARCIRHTGVCLVSRNYPWYWWWRSHCRFQRWLWQVWQHVCPNQCEGGMTVLSCNTMFLSHYTVDTNHMLAGIRRVTCSGGRPLVFRTTALALVFYRGWCRDIPV